MSWTGFCDRWLGRPLAGLLFLAALALSGCLDGAPLEPLRVGDPAPPFTLTLTDGQTVRSLADFRGKGLVVTFMASWCPCSNDSLPMFAAQYQRVQGRAEFLMIGIQEAESKFNAFVKERKIAYLSAFDRANVAREYGVNAPPTTVFIDADGKVKRYFYGNIKDRQELFPQWVDEVL